jgi:hypothetical protein
MNILINGYGVDFALENEKNVKEVCASILDWTKKRDMIFTDLYIDGELYSMDSLPDMDITSVGSINCIVQSKSDLILSTLHEAVTYCERIIGHISDIEKKGKADLSQKEALSRGIVWMLDASRVIFSILVLDEKEIRYLDKTIDQYFTKLSECGKAIESAKDANEFKKILLDNRNLFETVKSVFKMLFLSDSLKNLIVKSLESPNQLIEGLKQIKEEIGGQVEKLEKAAVFFQSGKDADGADIMQSFIDFIYRYIRLCHQISPVFGIDPAEISSGDDNMEKTNSAIYSYLEEIVSVMENSDIISLSDILEYQMKPEVEKCAPFIQLVLEKIS